MAKIKKTWNWSELSRHDRGYGTQWNKIRLRVLQRDHGLCQCEVCTADGKITTTRATQVHHIISKSEGGTDDMCNLISLASDCHDRITAARSRTRLPVIGIDGYPLSRLAKHDI